MFLFIYKKVKVTEVNMIQKKNLGILSIVLGTAIAWAGQAEFTFDRYHSPAELNQALKKITAANSKITELFEIAVTPAGKPLTMLYIGPEAARKEKRLPAILVVANMEGTVPLASEAAMFLIQAILEKIESRQDKGWYILPTGNPAAAAKYFSKPLIQDSGNSRPHNDDMDDRTDEDGPEDLDGNGIITMIRVRDTEGEWLPVSAEPRLLKKADSAKGEKGLLKLYSEGIDNDRDGHYNEDGPGGVNIGINFPHLFHNFTKDGGEWPGSENESLGLIRFVFQHPEIAMTVAFGASNFCLTPPKSGRKGEADYSKIKIPKQIGAFLNVDTDKTYTMEEVMEIARNLAPPGFELTEPMVASFLGLGAVVNPLPEDLSFYKELADQYKEYLKKGKLDSARLETPDAKDGSFELWSYYHLGVPTFSMDFWTVPEVKKDEKAEAALTPEKLESMTNEEFIALGEEKINAFLKGAGAPEDFNAAMVINTLKGGMMNTKKMAEMLREMPKPKSDEGADPLEKALLAFSDKELQGKGFVAWKPFRHPGLKEVEIGGFVPYAANTPPATMIQSLLKGQVPWVFQLAEKLPHLRIAKTENTPLGNGLFRLKVWVENSGYLPLPTAMGSRNERITPAIITLKGKHFTVLEGLKRTILKEIGGGKTRMVSWIISSEQPLKLNVELTTPMAWNDAKAIEIGGVK
jgi:hypothetical protein